MQSLKDIFKTELKIEKDEEFIVFLKESLEKYGFNLESQQILDIIIFLKFLLEENEKYNLTSIKKFEEMIYKHIIDSLLILKVIEIKNNFSFLDVGTGAGFPSTPIAIAKKDINITQLDSSKKKVEFLKQVNKMLSLKTIPLNERAENLAKREEYREKFNIVSARAVAKLNILSELCLPFVEVGGFFVALKGPEYLEDLELAKKSINILGGKVEKVENFEIEKNQRNIVVIKKISHSSTKYPRSFSKISKTPL